MERITKFLSLYKKAFKDDHLNNHADWALYCLLSLNKKEIEFLFDDPDCFHKAFRQIDVTDTGDMDMAIWHLIHASTYFWEVFNDFVTTYKWGEK